MRASFLLPVLALILFSCQPEKTNTETSAAQSVEKSTVKTIKAAEFKSRSEQVDAILVDVRTPAEVADGKIPNALVINIYDSDFQSKISQLPKEKSILIYCSAGVRSAKAADFLVSQGYSSVYHLQDGLGDWINLGFPYSR